MVFSGLELGKLSGISDMDKVNGSLDIEGTGFIPDSMNISASLTIDSAGFRGYNYHDINAEVNGEHGLFEFVFKSPDPLFRFDLTGMLSGMTQLTWPRSPDCLTWIPGSLIYSGTYL